MGNAPDPARRFAASAGTARRVEELYTAHARLVRSVCRSLLRDRNEAEDAVQQTFLSAQRALVNGSSPREPAAWLATIARNECLARVRERMREPLPVEEEPAGLGVDAHSAAVSRYEVASLREALAELPPAQREAILLREMRGLSYDEVARVLSVSTGAVESLIFRARRTLQVRLSEALAALSPAALLGRVFAGGGGDLTGPAVAKVAAIGVGATILAGGAALGPHAFGLGHAVRKVQHTAPRVHVQAPPPAHIWSRPEAASADKHDATVAGETATADVSETVASDTATETAASDTSESRRPEKEKETVTASTSPTHESGGSDDPPGSDDPSGSDDSTSSGD
jgi:RNA polymerase sigma-70 factor (ECF subfamily)